jgi:choline dehydrogenase-like flavoprotein
VASLDSLRVALADRYRLDRQLGQGGMAIVYLAHDLKHDRDVTLKVLRPELAAVLGPERRAWGVPIQPQTWGVHLLGTCRMGDDPSTSVVDRDHRTHDVPNLFICDGSSLVTSSRGQPTATIQALAYRAGERIAELAKRREI